MGGATLELAACQNRVELIKAMLQRIRLVAPKDGPLSVINPTHPSPERDRELIQLMVTICGHPTTPCPYNPTRRAGGDWGTITQTEQRVHGGPFDVLFGAAELIASGPPSQPRTRHNLVRTVQRCGW